MFYEMVSMIFGIIKILLYKMIYPFRISFKGIPKMNSSFSIATKKGTRIIIGKGFRTRNNISLRIYNKGLLSIGNNCFMNDSCSINCQKKVVIGDNVIFGQNVMIFDHDHDYKNDINNFVRKDVTIGNNVWIGANSIILKGVHIGNNVVIAAGTIVRENVSDNMLVYQERIITTKKTKI